MPRYICIHGHFYQPPRENPWLETVEIQESASPWHDWNARISAECYGSNSASRILNSEGEIAKICNNYSKMSFNFGPTLLSWLEENDNLCYRAIIEADVIGRKKFSGHGPAMAQVYNHIIMPLANRRDKETQVKWAVSDFQKRFGRMPEGMWLAECAVDTETLEVLAENNIKFTVLSPYQAEAVRFAGRTDWIDVRGGCVDTRCAYKCKLPSGKSIALFFYDGVLSQKIAFQGLLNDGAYFARQLIDAHADSGRPVLSHVATDGESYGHHHKYGDMALAYCLETIDNSSDAQLTVYGEFLEFYPPEQEVKIIENSSWSCAHGVERWRSNCGCNTGTPNFHQEWRGPLREALDNLRDKLASLYEKAALKYFDDPWEARNNYIDILTLHDRTDENVDKWLKANLKKNIKFEQADKIFVLSLMEMQRDALYMFTSCGWFFDEISRIEPIQILRYAARAMELAKKLFNINLEPEFLEILEKAPSNIPELRNGAKIYELLVKQSRVDMPQMAAYYAITSLMHDFTPSFVDGAWKLSGSALRFGEDANSFSAGTVRVHSRITGEERAFLFAANHMGGTAILSGVMPLPEIRALTMQEVTELRELFKEEPGYERKLVEKFGYMLYSLRHIPADAQHRLLRELLKQDVLRIETGIRDIVRNYDQLLEYLTTLEVRPPVVITAAAEFSLTSDIVHRLEEPRPNVTGIRRDFELAGFWQIKPNEEQIRTAFSNCLKRLLSQQCDEPWNTPLMENISRLIDIFSEQFKWTLSLYESQNLYFQLLRRFGKSFKSEAAPQRELVMKIGKALKFSDELLSKY